jgi:hypothetical protein
MNILSIFARPNHAELARQKLAEDVERRRNSYEIIRYREKRAAALKHTRGVA